LRQRECESLRELLTLSETDHLGFSLSERKREREIRAAEKTRARARERGLGFMSRATERRERQKGRACV
jgi:hypothetical protein